MSTDDFIKLALMNLPTRSKINNKDSVNDNNSSVDSSKSFKMMSVDRSFVEVFNNYKVIEQTEILTGKNNIRS